jgi:hypothetical protein
VLERADYNASKVNEEGTKLNRIARKGKEKEEYFLALFDQ